MESSSSSKSSLMSVSAAIKRFSQPFWAGFTQDASCEEVHVKRDCTARYYHYNMKVLCLDAHHYSLFLFAFLSPPPLLIFPFYATSTSKVSTSSCLWTPNSAYMLAFRWEHGVLESFDITLCRAVSLDFSGCSGPDVPFSGAETLRRPVQTGHRTGHRSRTSEVAESKVTFYTASVGMFKGSFYRRFKPDCCCFVRSNWN